MFAEFINEYGTTILYTIITAIAGWLGIVVKNLYAKHINTKTKKDIAYTVVLGVEQIYKDLHGEEKLNKALITASEMLAAEGIKVSELELKMLIEAAVAEFNDAFHKSTGELKNEEAAAMIGFQAE